MEHFRDYDVGGMSFNKTGRICEFCGSDLIDTLLDWEDALPEWDWERAQDQCRKADLVIALGTSLRIEPAGSLPAMGKQFVIVNLQETPYDNKAKLIVRAPVDDALEKVMEGLGYMKDWSASVEEAKIERHWQQPPAEDSDDEE
jgi:mono-ADP-ribosyltransferase sirtuin 6